MLFEMEHSVEVDLWRHQTQLQMEGLWCHETKRSKRVLLCCDVEFLYKNSNVLKNKQLSTFQSENLISVKSRSREIFCQKCDLITPIITQIDLDIGPTIKGMMFHHRPITPSVLIAKLNKLKEFLSLIYDIQWTESSRVALC